MSLRKIAFVQYQAEGEDHGGQIHPKDGMDLAIISGPVTTREREAQ